MTIHTPLPLLNAILAPWKDRLGADFEGYKNHCTRMTLCCFALRECSEEEKLKVQIAAAHHDIGIWSDNTVDYLPPSIRQAQIYLAANKLQPWSDEITVMIDLHHKLRAIKDEKLQLAEAFRKADLVDFSLGLVRFGLPRSAIQALKAAYPNAGFHKMQSKSAAGWFAKHPLSPPPFMKW